MTNEPITNDDYTLALQMSANNSPNSSVQLALESVSVAFDGHAPVLSEIDFSIPAGRFVSLVGPSGCGKTTILRLVAGLLAPTTGRLRMVGEPRIAFVFQEAESVAVAQCDAEHPIAAGTAACAAG